MAFFAPTPTGGELEVEGSSRVRELKRDEVVFIVEATVVENHASGHLGGKLQAHIELGSLMVWSLLNSIFCQLFTVQEQYFSIKVLLEKNYTTVELNIFVTIQLRANLKVPAERP